MSVQSDGQLTAAAPLVTSVIRDGQIFTLEQNALIEELLPLVRNIARGLLAGLPSHCEEDELYSTGIVGLVEAVRRHDPQRQATFRAYAAMRIRGAIIEGLRENDWCPRRLRSLVERAKCVVSDLEQKFCRPVTDEEVFREMGVTVGKYREIKMAMERQAIVLDALTRREDSDGIPVYEVFADEESVTGRDRLEKTELKEMVCDALSHLSEIQRKVVTLYYFKGKTIDEIRQMLNLTGSRVYQINREALGIFRQYFTCDKHW